MRSPGARTWLAGSRVDNASPIGVFDSGLGGLTVVRAIRRQLPDESIVYLGDTARVPYGSRTAATVCRYAEGCASVLVERGVKALVVACNTASAVALDSLASTLEVPVIGVIAPGAHAAVSAAKALATAGADARIGVLGTEGTIRSGAYLRAVQSLAPHLEVIGMAAPLLVPLAEEGWVEGEVPRLAAERYVRPLIEGGANVIVLGCTHYPLLEPLIRAAAERASDGPIRVVDSAETAAQALSTLLLARGLATRPGTPPRLELLATDLPSSFHAAARRFLGAEVGEVSLIDITQASGRA